MKNIQENFDVLHQFFLNGNKSQKTKTEIFQLILAFNELLDINEIKPNHRSQDKIDIECTEKMYIDMCITLNNSVKIYDDLCNKMRREIYGEK